MLPVVCSVFFSLCASFPCWRGVAQRWREKLERLLQQSAESVRCAVHNSKLWVCIIGSLSVFLPTQIIRLTAQSDLRVHGRCSLSRIKVLVNMGSGMFTFFHPITSANIQL